MELQIGIALAPSASVWLCLTTCTGFRSGATTGAAKAESCGAAIQPAPVWRLRSEAGQRDREAREEEPSSYRHYRATESGAAAGTNPRQALRLCGGTKIMPRTKKRKFGLEPTHGLSPPAP